MTLFKDIIELLHNNDCVIVPGFGAFVLKSKAASIRGNEFIPPAKYVSFNSMLKENDGLLVKYISEIRKISYKKALIILEDEVNSLNKKLSKDLLVEIPSLGIFELKNESTLYFNPDLSVNYNSSSFGLKSFLKDPDKIGILGPSLFDEDMNRRTNGSISYVKNDIKKISLTIKNL